MPDHISLGDLIRQQRAALGLTQARLAELVGKSSSTIRSWERDRSRPADDASLSALAAVLGLSENQVQQAMWTAPAQKSDMPASTSRGSQALAGDPEVVLADEFSFLGRDPEPDASEDGEGVEPAEDAEPTEVAEPAEVAEAVEVAEPPQASRVTSTDPVEMPAAVVPSDVDTVVSNEFFAPPGKPASARRFRLGDLADLLRSTSAVSRRPRVPSYLDDPTEIRTYRVRTVLTAALLVFMVIVLLWAIGEAREAFSLIY